MVRKIAKDKERYIRPHQANMFLQQFAKELPLNSSQICGRSINAGLKKIPFRFMGSTLTDISLKGEVEDINDRNIDNLTQGFFSMDWIVRHTHLQDLYDLRPNSFMTNMKNTLPGPWKLKRQTVSHFFYTQCCCRHLKPYLTAYQIEKFWKPVKWNLV